MGDTTTVDNTGKEKEILCNNDLLVASPPQADVPRQAGPDVARLPIQDNSGCHPLTDVSRDDDILATPPPAVPQAHMQGVELNKPDNTAALQPPTAAGTCAHTERGVCSIHGQA